MPSFAVLLHLGQDIVANSHIAGACAFGIRGGIKVDKGAALDRNGGGAVLVCGINGIHNILCILRFCGLAGGGHIEETVINNQTACLHLESGRCTVIVTAIDNYMAAIDINAIAVVIAGFGGLFYVMDYACGVWSNEGFGDRGWLAIALVIFAIWKPDIGILGSILFGGLYIVHHYIPGLPLRTQELIKMLPYVVTIIVLVITSIRNKKENQPPASLGLHYFREER